MDIEIKKPCPANWDAMSGDDKSRFCGQCKKSVHNIDAMTAEEASEVLCMPGKNSCIRVTRNSDGAFRTQTGWVKRVAIAGAASLVLLPVAGCQTGSDVPSVGKTSVSVQTPSGQSVVEETTPEHKPQQTETITGDVAPPPVNTDQGEVTVGKIAVPDPENETTIGILAPSADPQSPN